LQWSWSTAHRLREHRLELFDRRMSDSTAWIETYEEIGKIDRLNRLIVVGIRHQFADAVQTCNQLIHHIPVIPFLFL
jgi:hypothetical protein